MGMRWRWVGFGLVAVMGATAWFASFNLSAKIRIEKEKLAKLETAKPDTENAIHQRAMIKSVPGYSSKISLSTATSYPVVTAPIWIFPDPARATFSTKVRIAMSTNGVASLAPSMSEA
ncbi:hypothetical protein PITC_059710 [Penicillium italicum]|uniref:Uncharacterized protein n=1 Tax=Penicillium italicum TaxID=40296 RepID=A0A0A2LEB4_PENIT|nr:hypothetical protein PITC_059710 [Penicillium italicum]